MDFKYTKEEAFLIFEEKMGFNIPNNWKLINNKYVPYRNNVKINEISPIDKEDTAKIKKEMLPFLFKEVKMFIENSNYPDIVKETLIKKIGA